MTATTTPPLIPGTREWAGLITASKVAAILGLSPYDSPLSCWHKMKGNIPLELETEDHRRGHYAEPAVIAWWHDQHPEFTDLKPQPQFTNPAFPWAAATPDVLATGLETAAALVEAKTARNLDEWGEPGTGEIPAYYLVQTLFQLRLAGLERAYVPVWGSWFDMAEYVVDYDAELADGIMARCAEFWASLESDEPPALDDSVATLQTLKALHPLIDEGAIADLTPAVAAEYIDASNDFKAAEARKRAAQSAVLDAMGVAQYGNYGDLRVARRQPARGDAIALYQVATTTEAINQGATS